MIVGFFLTMSYKSVLRGMMMKVYHEKTIDTIDDMLASERILMIQSDLGIPGLMARDPRIKVNELAARAQHYRMGTGYGIENERVVEG